MILYVYEFGFWGVCADGLRPLKERIPIFCWSKCCEIPISGFIQFPWPWGGAVDFVDFLHIGAKYGSKITQRACATDSPHITHISIRGWHNAPIYLWIRKKYRRFYEVSRCLLCHRHPHSHGYLNTVTRDLWLKFFFINRFLSSRTERIVKGKQ